MFNCLNDEQLNIIQIRNDRQIKAYVAKAKYLLYFASFAG